MDMRLRPTNYRSDGPDKPPKSPTRKPKKGGKRK